MTNYSDFDKVALQNNKNIKNPRSHSARVVAMAVRMEIIMLMTIFQAFALFSMDIMS